MMEANLLTSCHVLNRVEMKNKKNTAYMKNGPGENLHHLIYGHVVV
jgi:hypothetical protein